MHFDVRSAFLRALAAGLLLGWPGSAVGQGSPHWCTPAVGPDDNFGAAVAVVGDADGDGRADLAVGAPLADDGGPDSGAVRLLDADGVLLRSFQGSAGDGFGGAVAGIGDLDGDGLADVAVGAPEGGYVQVLSSATGGEIWRWPGDDPADAYGHALAGGFDLDGDGTPDVLVGAPGADGIGQDAGLARVHSGATGEVLFEALGASAGEGLGAVVAAAGRVDGDDVEDFVLGGFFGSNRVVVVSGATGGTIHEWFGGASIEWFGTSVAGVGDLDLDGRGDVAVGASGSFFLSGYVRVFSGASGAELFTAPGNTVVDLFGWSVAPAGDLDLDGRGDVAVGVPFADAAASAAGKVVFLSGSGQGVLFEVPGSNTDEAFGWSIAGARGGFAAGAPNAGRACSIDLGPRALGTPFCRPAVPNSSGSPGVMIVTGSEDLADDALVLTAIQLPAAANIGYFIMGTGSNTFVPPGSAGPICVAPGIVRYLPPVNNTSQLGGGFSRDVGATGPVSGNLTPGSTWSFQAWHRDGMNPSNLTDAVRVTFRP